MTFSKVLCLTVVTLFLCLPATAQEGKSKQKNSRRQTGNIEQMLKRLDKNGDSQLTADEIPDRMKQRMSRIDLDNNGVLDQQELRKAVQRMNSGQQGSSQAKNKRRKKGSGKNGKGKQPQGSPKGQAKGEGQTKGKGRDASPDQMVQGMTKRLDKNGDGVISKDETPDRMQQNWSRIDKNGNGQLDQAELKQVAAMMQRRGGGKTKSKGKGRDSEQKKGGGVKPKRPGGGNGK